MAKEVMTRTASDNPYLHKDFHGTLNTGLEYLRHTYGPKAVRQYLRQFAAAFYAPLTQALQSRGLVAMKEYLERIYGLEGGQIAITCTSDELRLTVVRCPAVAHIQSRGWTVDPLFIETTRTVYEAICENTPFAFDLVDYDPSTGRSTLRFFKRADL